MVEEHISGGQEDFDSRMGGFQRPQPVYNLNARTRFAVIGRGVNGPSTLDRDFELSYPFMIERRKDTMDLPVCYNRGSVFGRLELEARRNLANGSTSDLEALKNISLDTYTGHPPIIECPDEDGFGVTLDYSRIKIK